MTDQTHTRRQKLEAFLLTNPNDAFSRYGLALDCFQDGDLPAAEANFQHLLQNSPDYVPAYQMYAQMLAKNNRIDDAKVVLTKGIASAARQGNHHAGSEMQSYLSDLN